MAAPVERNPGPASRIGSRQHFRWLEGIVKVTLVLNLVDAVFTLLWVWAGLASEANPLLAELVLEHPIAFVSVKLALVGLGSMLLWWRRQRPLAVVAIFLAFLVYYGILLLHIDYLATVVGILLSA
ncbi:MAG: DUF5658 family protein [Myxococcota bacterium]